MGQGPTVTVMTHLEDITDIISGVPVTHGQRRRRQQQRQPYLSYLRLVLVFFGAPLLTEKSCCRARCRGVARDPVFTLIAPPGLELSRQEHSSATTSSNMPSNDYTRIDSGKLYGMHRGDPKS